jgi:hypothetical protein
VADAVALEPDRPRQAPAVRQRGASADERDHAALP